MTKRDFPHTLLLKFFLIFFFFCTFILFVTSTFAQVPIKGYNLHHHIPALDPFSLGSLPNTEMMRPGEFYLAIETDYSGGQFSVNYLGQAEPLLDTVLAHTAVVSLGVANFLTIGVTGTYFSYVRGETTRTGDFDIGEADFIFTQNNTSSFGDARIFSKWRIHASQTNSWIPGLGVLIWTTLPSGPENRFLGDATPTHAAELFIEKAFEKIRFVAALGYQSIPESFVFSINQDDRWIAEGGIKVPVHFASGIELDVSATVRATMLVQNPSTLTSPSEGQTRVRLTHPSGLGLSAGAGAAFNNAVGGPDYRVFGSVFWHKRRKDREPPRMHASVEKHKSTPPVFSPFASLVESNINFSIYNDDAILMAVFFPNLGDCKGTACRASRAFFNESQRFVRNDNWDIQIDIGISKDTNEMDFTDKKLGQLYNIANALRDDIKKRVSSSQNVFISLHINQDVNGQQDNIRILLVNPLTANLSKKSHEHNERHNFVTAVQSRERRTKTR